MEGKFWFNGRGHASLISASRRSPNSGGWKSIMLFAIGGMWSRGIYDDGWVTLTCYNGGGMHQLLTPV